jgi:hypothetical protein
VKVGYLHESNCLVTNLDQNSGVSMLNELQLYTPVLGNLCQNSDLHMGYIFDSQA